MSFSLKLFKSIVRIIIVLFSVLLVLYVLYFFWTPGTIVNDGKYDLGKNAIWLQHAWLGDDNWFRETRRNADMYRNIDNIRKLSAQLLSYNIVYVYPHLCPADRNGKIPNVDAQQTRMFMKEMNAFKIMPWVGGVLDKHCFPDSKEWRICFINSLSKLFEEYPAFAGIHINIEPMPTENKGYIELLKEIKQSLPKGKILSVAAYPPPTIWHRFPDVHWNKTYYKEITEIADQMAVMMYDTAITDSKLYQWLISSWTGNVMDWTGNAAILLGVPAYNDSDTDYHNPDVENIGNSIEGINTGLAKFKTLPHCYEGIAIYCEWEMNDNKWNSLYKNFIRKSQVKMTNR